MAKEIKTLGELRIFIMNLLEKYEPNYLDLDKYLQCLWTATQDHKDKKMLTYSLICEMLENAFDEFPWNLNWNEEIYKAYQYPIKSEVNTPEYFKEARTYEYFERRLKTQIIDLKRIKNNLPPHDKYWMNINLANYLERGTYTFEDDDDTNDDDITWWDLGSILNGGKYNE